MNKNRLRARGGFGGASFTPASISGLQLWLDAADAATITQVANAVSQWNDKSGNGRNFEQTTGSRQPLTNTSTLNGRNALDFDGAGDNLVRTNTDLSTALANDCTIIIFGKQDAIGTQQTLFRKDGGEFNMQVDSGGATFVASHSTAFNFSTLTAAADTNPHTWGMYVQGSTVWAFRDGSVAPSGSATATAAGQINIGSDRFSGLPFNGLIAEVLCYNRRLTNAEINQICGVDYGATKWGTPWTNL